MGLLDQLNEVLLQTPRKYWGDKATRLGSLLGDAASTGAQAYGSANSPMAPEHANTLAGLLADFTPVVGDVKSAYDGMQSAREGDYLGAALGGLGALPLVPNLAGFGGVLDAVAKINGKPLNIYAKPTSGEIGKMLREQRNAGMNGSVRLLKDPDTGKVIGWNGMDATHDDLMEHLGKHMPQESRYEIFTPSDYMDLHPELYGGR